MLLKDLPGERHCCTIRRDCQKCTYL